MTWKPEHYCDDPTADAILNVAAQLNEVAKAINELLYGLKYGKNEGMSIAEAIEVGAKMIASAMPTASE